MPLPWSTAQDTQHQLEQALSCAVLCSGAVRLGLEMCSCAVYLCSSGSAPCSPRCRALMPPPSPYDSGEWPASLPAPCVSVRPCTSSGKQCTWCPWCLLIAQQNQQCNEPTCENQPPQSFSQSAGDRSSLEECRYECCLGACFHPVRTRGAASLRCAASLG